MYKLASGLTTEQSSTVVEEKTFIQSVEKDTANNIINSTKGVNGSTLAVDSVVGIDPEDIIENNVSCNAYKKTGISN